MVLPFVRLLVVLPDPRLPLGQAQHKRARLADPVERHPKLRLLPIPMTSAILALVPGVVDVERGTRPPLLTKLFVWLLPGTVVVVIAPVLIGD